MQADKDQVQWRQAQRAHTSALSTVLKLNGDTGNPLKIPQIEKEKPFFPNVKACSL